MRSEREVEGFRAGLIEHYGDDEDKRVAYYSTCYEAGVPRTFWDVAGADVTYNTEAFKSVILKYTARWRRARRHGYSLLLVGDNGTGKTMFVSFVLTQMIKRGATAYYTTLAQLDIDIKRGFKDGEAEARLELLLGADFIAIDELGKEHFKGDSYLATRLELLLKRRYDDGEPVILATNLSYQQLVEMYGPTIESMLDGKYAICQLESGDFRKSIRSRMRKDMGL